MVYGNGAATFCGSTTRAGQSTQTAVDVLFRSVPRECGRNAIGVFSRVWAKTAQKRQAMLDAGSQTIARTKATSVVWGCPVRQCPWGPPSTLFALDSVAQRYAHSRDSMDITGKRARRDPELKICLTPREDEPYAKLTRDPEDILR